MLPHRAETIAELRSDLRMRRKGRSVGLVPTMGSLHQGHGALVKRAVAENDLVVLSIFVNPLQFDDKSDWNAYPRNYEQDLQMAAEFGCDVVFTPTAADMYPSGVPLVSLVAPQLTDRLEGAFRPGHFDGVLTVVAKLFNIVDPERAYFGEKDYQQLALVRRLVLDLSAHVQIVGCPTVRAPDGVALSSRNVLLSAVERKKASLLHAALRAGETAARRGECQPETVELAMRAALKVDSDVEVDYAVAVDCETLEPLQHLDATFRLLIAAKIGTTRLIDNYCVDPL